MTARSLSESQEKLFGAVCAGLEDVGYSGDLLQPNYKYVDYFRSATPSREIQAACFGRLPAAYDTALLGIAASNGIRGRALADSHRALGAPLILEVDQSHVQVWSLGADESKTSPKEQLSADEFRNWTKTNASSLKPEEFLRTKNIRRGETAFFQGSLFAGLIPELEERIAEILEPRLTAAFRAGMNTYQEAIGKPPSEAAIFKLTFWLLTGKVFYDRGHPKFVGLGPRPSPDEVLEKVAAHYKDEVGRLLNGPTRQAVFSRIWTEMDFRNLSVDSLSQIWSRTLVTPETRKRLGIHRTRRSIVDFIVERIPFQEFGKDECNVLEPCTGSASFLVAAMDRMRYEFTFDDPAERHTYFKRKLSGFEQDPFGVEISRLCLALSDYPNPNHWKIEPDNVFVSDKLPAALKKARVVLCNPPFRRFSRDQKESYGAELWEPPAELLRLVLTHLHPDGVIGFVLPRTFINGQWFSSVRQELVRRFSDLEIVRLPDKGWEHADPETALLIATKPQRSGAAKSQITYGVVRENEWQEFDWLHEIPKRIATIVDENSAHDSFVLSPLAEVWDHLKRCQSLGDVAAARHGLRWKRGLRDHFDEIVKSRPTSGHAKGIRPRLRAFFSFQRPQTAYLLFSRDEIKKAFDLHWDQPKVIMNKTAKARSRWRVAAFADSDGLVCSESSLAVWPNSPALLKPLAAVLNGPVANAFLSERSGKREFTTDVIHQIPFPNLSGSQVKEVNRLVDAYVGEVEKNDLKSDEDDAKANAILRNIDAAILEAYDLPPRLERQLLDHFDGDNDRQVPFAFANYYPSDFKPRLSLAYYLSEGFSHSTAGRIKDRLESAPQHAIDALNAAEKSFRRKS